MKVAVVGGGIVGLSTAYFLAERGVEVTVLERGACGSGASGGNTGWITPGVSSEPLAAPGLVGQGLRWMLKPESPFYIQPRPSLELARWLWGFWRSSSADRHRVALKALVRLNAETLEIFDGFKASGVAFEMHEDGLLYPALSREVAAKISGMYACLRDGGYGGTFAELGGDEIRALEPALSPSVVAGVISKDERHVRPETLTTGLAQALSARGTCVRENTGVVELSAHAGRWKLALANHEDIEVDKAVVAAGMWTKPLLARLGVSLPMLAGKGYSVTASGSGTRPSHPLYMVETRVAMSPYQPDVLRVGGTLELTGFDLSLPRRRLDPLLRVSNAYLRDWRPEHTELEWAGLRPLLPDCLPVIGQVPGCAGLYVATGHGMVGMTLGPPSAKELAQLIVDGTESPAIRPFRPDRILRFGTPTVRRR